MTTESVAAAEPAAEAPPVTTVPIRFREAMATLYAVVGSDYRYVPKDRTAYLAYLRMRRESASLNVRQAQQGFFEWALRNDPLAFILLDPVVTVHPDQVFFEVFSKDEAAYAKLGFDLNAFDLAYQPVCGTTNIDFSPAPGCLQHSADRPLQPAPPPAAARRPQGPPPRPAHRAGARRGAAAGAGAVGDGADLDRRRLPGPGRPRDPR